MICLNDGARQCLGICSCGKGALVTRPMDPGALPCAAGQVLVLGPGRLDVGVPNIRQAQGLLASELQVCAHEPPGVPPERHCEG